MGMIHKGLLAAVCLVPLTAGAVDGVIEINHARALAGGVTPGDAPGYPVTITQAGSYRLTGNLTQPDPNIVVVHVTAEGVTLDLNGFAIKGSANCRYLGGANLTCDVPLAGNGHGVLAEADGVNVTNGSVIGMGGSGLRLRSGHASKLYVAHNAGTGVYMSGVAQDIVASHNALGGIGGPQISASLALVVVNVVATYNGQDGIFQVAVARNVVSSFNQTGISTAGSVDGCQVTENRDDGINIVGSWSGCFISGNADRAISSALRPQNTSYCDGVGCP
jgi:hypothetical protein